jgi:hypothetical protein
MDQLARDEIAAAAAAHRELGRDYDGAVAVVIGVINVIYARRR